MFELKEYRRVKNLDEAFELMEGDKKNVVLGGLLWMRLGTRKFNTGIDLSALGLDRIEETDSRIEIGAMTTLRQVETSDLILNHFGPVLRQAVSSIVGVQFRNLATVGGSVFSKFSFSDLITALLVLDTQVHLYRGGMVPLAEFLDSKPGRDILVKLSIGKQTITTCYQSMRKTATDFPVLTAAVARTNEAWKIAVGARPARAKLALDAAAQLPDRPGAPQVDRACATLVKELGFSSNQRASSAYREHLAAILVKRGINEICS